MVLPQPEDAKIHMLYLDYGFKIQILLTDFINIMWWSSILDILIFVFTFCSFLAAPATASGIFIFSLHVVRGVLGILIVLKVPKSSQIMDEVSKKFNTRLSEPITLQKFPEFAEECLKVLF